VLGAFALNLTRLGRRVTQQLVLPGRRRPGNLLSSLFLLFIGLAEDAIALRRALIRIPLALDVRLPARERLDAAWIYSKRYLRLGVVAAAWILFILSSLEWSRAGAAPAPDQPATTAATATAVTKADAIVVIAASDAPQLSPAIIAGDEPVFRAIPQQYAPMRRWLRFCSIRI